MMPRQRRQVDAAGDSCATGDAEKQIGWQRPALLRPNGEIQRQDDKEGRDRVNRAKMRLLYCEGRRCVKGGRE